MDIQHILTLVVTLTGNSGDEFARFKAGATDPKSPIAQIICPRPLPANEIEGNTLFCGTVRVPENNAKPDGKKITLSFSVLKSCSQYPEPDPAAFGSKLSDDGHQMPSFHLPRDTQGLWEHLS